MESRLQKLEALRDSLTQRLERYHQHQKRADGPLDPDFAEQATEVQNDEVVEALEEEGRDRLIQVNHALARIQQDMGDICARCQANISEGRLKALPEATLCADCASSEQ
ncbi:MAG: TraR/DksA C4-type zinc finger protein [Alcanivoracaceae bacterium]|nr:TraR/DksA C4-type zinc finger protein [Alcanivoracaceae bacterium]